AVSGSVRSILQWHIGDAARVVHPTAARDWIRGTHISMAAQAEWNNEADLVTWLTGARLNAVSAMNDHFGEPAMQSALGRYITNSEPGLAKLRKLAATR